MSRRRCCARWRGARTSALGSGPASAERSPTPPPSPSGPAMRPPTGSRTWRPRSSTPIPAGTPAAIITQICRTTMHAPRRPPLLPDTLSPRPTTGEGPSRDGPRFVRTTQAAGVPIHHRTGLCDERPPTRQHGLEEVGHLLAAAGPTPDVLDAVLGVLTEQSGYRQVSLHLLHPDGMARLAAQRGYAVTVDFDGTRGVIGRVMRTHEPAFGPDRRGAPDYSTANPDVTGEICVPLLAHGELLGILNVESPADRPLP